MGDKIITPQEYMGGGTGLLSSSNISNNSKIIVTKSFKLSGMIEPNEFNNKFDFYSLARVGVRQTKKITTITINSSSAITKNISASMQVSYGYNNDWSINNARVGHYILLNGVKIYDLPMEGLGRDFFKGYIDLDDNLLNPLWKNNFYTGNINLVKGKNVFELWIDHMDWSNTHSSFRCRGFKIHFNN